MYLWQFEISYKIIESLSSFSCVENVELKGSCLNPATVDKFSDVDIVINLSDNYKGDFLNEIRQVFKPIGTVFAYEEFRYEKQDVLRLCLDNGFRFDFTINYYLKKDIITLSDYSDLIGQKVNEFWFSAIMSVVKLGRSDYLIATHLAFELCQIIIVIQMLKRDFEKNTNIHRYGDKEYVPALNVMNENVLNQKTVQKKILQIILSITQIMDEFMLEISENYFTRNDTFKRICSDLLGPCLEFIAMD